MAELIGRTILFPTDPLGQIEISLQGDTIKLRREFYEPPLPGDDGLRTTSVAEMYVPVEVIGILVDRSRQASENACK